MSLTEKKLPVDRTIFFSDAVFAIAMTLLILEIKLPTREEVEALGIAKILVKRIPNFIGFTVSFLVTALFWKSHLQVCALAKEISNRFLWINIWLLFFVVLMPFSTALYSSYGFLNNVAFGFYCLNIAAIGFFNYWLMMHVIKSQQLDKTVDKKTLRWKKQRTLTVPVIFLLCVLIAQVSITLSRYGFLLIFIVQWLGDWLLARRMKPQLVQDKAND